MLVGKYNRHLSWPRSTPVLGVSAGPWRRPGSRPAVYVDRAETLGAIAVIRSLGRAGYEVHAASAQAHSLGSRSRYAAHAPVHPPLDEPGFVDWFRRYVDEHRVAAIVPSEALILSLGEHLDEFRHLIPYARSSMQLRRAFGKYDLFESSLQHGLTHHLPPLRLLDFERGGDAAHGDMRFPAFVKTDAVHARSPGQPGEVLQVHDPDNLEATLRSASRRFRRAVVQGYAPGTGVGASFLIWDGEPQAEFLHRRLHEVPYTGGVSSWRTEFRHATIRDDALARIKALEWDRGPVMVEYRLDAATGEFWLMEVNARFWGSLHLPYYAGVDFPALLLHRFLESRGVPVPPAAAPALRRRAVSCRHLPAELQHCWGKLKSRQVAPAAKLKAVSVLLALTVDPRVKSDLGSFPGDRRLLAISLSRFFAGAARALLTRLRRHVAAPVAAKQ